MEKHRKDKGPPTPEVRLLYLRQAKHHFTTTLAAWGAIYESLRDQVWLAKHTTLLVFSQTPDSASGTLGPAWYGLGEAVNVPAVLVILRDMLGL
jgi:hypothetical protein